MTVLLPLSDCRMWILSIFCRSRSSLITPSCSRGFGTSSGSDSRVSSGVILSSEVHVCSSGVQSLLTMLDSHPLLPSVFLLLRISVLLISEISLLTDSGNLVLAFFLDGMKLRPRQRVSTVRSVSVVVDWLIRNFCFKSVLMCFAEAKNCGL